MYSISINDIIVYVGKSRDILYRMAEHWVSTSTPENNKYSVLAEAKSRNMKIKFDVLYRAKSKKQTEIDEEIGEREGYYIRKHKPPLNYQIP
ncbi:MAG: GIY-YIG nuclease family protein [Clostridia bacterium]|nr:GIY-YIG nuclease family protein [Clostridia bacterium]